MEVSDERLTSCPEKAPERVWTFWRTENTLAPLDIRTTDRPAPYHSPCILYHTDYLLRSIECLRT
jgi:hypothetical protein